MAKEKDVLQKNAKEDLWKFIAIISIVLLVLSASALYFAFRNEIEDNKVQHCQLDVCSINGINYNPLFNKTEQTCYCYNGNGDILVKEKFS